MEEQTMKQLNRMLWTLPAIVVLISAVAFADHTHTSTKFEGVKANTGTVTHSKEDGKDILTLSNDFKTPDAPAQHWQIVDTEGNIYLLNRLVIKGDKYNESITVPSYIKDIAKVRIWCAWAEALLGETSFEHPIKLNK